MAETERELRLRDGDQPLPTPNHHPAITDLVVTDIEARRQLGITRYGTPLQPYNGRDALRDAYEEALDLVHYLRQAIYERDTPDSCPGCDHMLTSHYTGTEVKTGCAYPGCPCQRSIPAAAAEDDREPTDYRHYGWDSKPAGADLVLSDRIRAVLNRHRIPAQDHAIGQVPRRRGVVYQMPLEILAGEIHDAIRPELSELDRLRKAHTSAVRAWEAQQEIIQAERRRRQEPEGNGG